jgi:hypothetical protein
VSSTEKTLTSPRAVFTVRSAPLPAARTRMVQALWYGFSASMGCTRRAGTLRA